MTSRLEIMADCSWRHQPKKYGLLVIGTIGFALTLPVRLAAIGAVVSLVADDGNWTAELVILLIGAGLAAALGPALAPALEFAQTSYVTDVAYRVRLRVMRSLAEVDMAFYDDPALADKAARAHDAVLWRPEKVTVAQMSILLAVIQIVGVVTVIAASGPVPTGLVVVGAISAAGADFLLERKRGDVEITRENDVRRQNTYSFPLLNADAATEIRIMGMPPVLLEGWWRHANRPRKLMLRVAIVTLPAAAAAGVVTGGALLAAVVLATRAGASAGTVTVTVGGLAAIASAVHQFMRRAGRLSEDLRLLQVAYDVAEVDPLLPRATEPRTLPAGPVDVTVRDVSFAYPGTDRRVLQEVSLHVPKGHVLAIVGENGAGKTTLVRLLMRLYDPSEGTILFEGIDLRDAGIDAVRSLSGVLAQDAIQFKLTVRDNVGYGRVDREPTDGDIRAALVAGGALGVAEDVGGIDGYIGRFWRGGHELSGGQWQRLTLARHAFRDARLWILDEPTSALDAEAEARVFRELRTRLDGRTGIVISHRMSTVRIADSIAVLSQGRVVETGTHDELIKRGGAYQRLFQEQSAQYQ